MLAPVQRVPVDLETIIPPSLRPWSRQLEPVLHWLLVPAEVASGLDRTRHTGTGGQFAQNLLASLDIRFTVEEADWKRLPARGAAVVVANHPYGIAEGLVLSVLLDRVRPDWKILANSMLAGVTEVREHMLPLNPFGTARANLQNRVPLRKSLAWLERGGVVAAFPAGEVAHFDWKQHCVSDSGWQSTAARLALRAGCAVVPVFFEGANSLPFQVAGVVHPGLRTFGLVRELAKLAGKTIRVRIGRPVPHRVLANCRDAAHATGYLRSRTLLLGHRPAAAAPRPSPRPAKRLEAIAPAEPEHLLAEEMAALPAESELARQGDFSVYLAAAEQIPRMLREIGRCREATFREIGEGTGKAADLDRFDHYYRHLLLWDHRGRALAGGYRLAVTTDVLPRFGSEGLYTGTLFRFRPGFFEKLGPAVELGRSFVRVEYQKDFAPLLLLWKGIMRLVERRPEAPVLFGAVSISREYCAASRGLLAAYLARWVPHPLARHVAPRKGFRGHAGNANLTHLAATVAGVEALSLAIADMESDGKGVPVLVRQYLKTGGRLLGLRVDPDFSDTLDALIVTDMREAPPALLERGLGRQEARAFLRLQGQAGTAPGVR
jgi:putative hemolysin